MTCDSASSAQRLSWQALGTDQCCHPEEPAVGMGLLLWEAMGEGGTLAPGVMEFNAVGIDNEVQGGPKVIKSGKKKNFRWPWLLGFVNHSDQKQGFYALDSYSFPNLGSLSHPHGEGSGWYDCAGICGILDMKYSEPPPTPRHHNSHSNVAPQLCSC